MRKILQFTTLFLTSFSCQAGYSEYQFLAPSACKSFSISSDTAPPDVNSSRASPDYKAYVAANGANSPRFWSLYDAPQATERWADCRETGNEIACTVVGPFRYSSFTCPLGQSKQWSRTCKTTGGQVGELKVYSVDTAEYEMGGEPIVNQYLQADQAMFEKRCHKPAVPR